MKIPWAPFNGIMINRIHWLMGSNWSLWQNYHFLPNLCFVHSIISINRLWESVSPKVIPLSGANCTKKLFLSLLIKQSKVLWKFKFQPTLKIWFKCDSSVSIENRKKSLYLVTLSAYNNQSILKIHMKETFLGKYIKCSLMDKNSSDDKFFTLCLN
jgi:hypothetical protein